MQRVKRSTAVAVLPADPAGGTPGYFPAPNPGGGIPAAVPGYEWYNNVQEEIISVILAAGGTLDGSNRAQMLAAIQTLIASGGATKTPVRAATTANIASLAGGAPNTLDGVALAANDRILVKDQTTGSQNGIYVVTTLGTGANGTWTRATDADGVGEIVAGMLVVSSEGTVNADAVWELTTDGTITVGTTALVFTRQNSDASTTTKGRVQLATVAEILAGTDALKAATAASLLAGLLGAGGASPADYITIPYRSKTDGSRKNLIIQWGTVTSVTANTNATWTYPITFPNACLCVFANSNVAGINGYASPTAIPGASSCSIQSSQGGSTNVFCLAIGY